jgi:hypothetical protein
MSLRLPARLAERPADTTFGDVELLPGSFDTVPGATRGLEVSLSSLFQDQLVEQFRRPHA